MEYKDAIKTIEVAKAEVEWNYPLDYQEAFDVAIKCIEKQIPKKPEWWHNQPYPPEWADDDWGYRCPACGNEDIDYPEHHCRCGQALDWSEVE